MKFILGKKMNMTQIWVDDKVVAVTPVLAGPCPIVQVKNKVTDGYGALKLAFGQKKEKNICKPQLGQFKNLQIKPQYVREFRLDNPDDFKAGDLISVASFAENDVINVTGTSKGKGFQGVVKRHGFHGFRKTHGNKDQERMPGSIGPKGPAHVFKGTRMGGNMGNSRVTVSNLTIIKVDVDNNLIFIKGALPGAINSLVMIKGEGELRVNLQPISTPATEEKLEEKNDQVEETINKSEELVSVDETPELVEEKSSVQPEENKNKEAKNEDDTTPQA